MRGRGLALLAAVAVAVGACGGDNGSSDGGPPQLTVSAAASLKAAFTDYGKQFKDADSKFSFAGSDELAAQIEKGVKPDLFAAANTKLPDALYDKGLVEKPTVFAGNRLVLAVPAGESKISSLTDLERKGVKLAIGAKDVPVGSYTHTVLDKLPLRLGRAGHRRQARGNPAPRRAATDGRLWRRGGQGRQASAGGEGVHRRAAEG
jgi:molybdate transport system substrate-binding protein